MACDLDLGDPGVRRTKEVAVRFVTDLRLRNAGFVIHARPRKGETVWTLNGEKFTQRQAEEYLRKRGSDGN